MATTKLRNTTNLDDLGEEELNDVDEAAFDQQVDFEQIKGVLDAGEYKLFNEKVKLVMSKNSGSPMFSLQIRVQGGSQDGNSLFVNASWKQGRAQVMSKNLFVGMGLPANFRGSLRDMASALEELEYFGVLTITQSDGINEATGRAYDPQNRLVSTSQDPQTDNVL